MECLVNDRPGLVIIVENRVGARGWLWPGPTTVVWVSVTGREQRQADGENCLASAVTAHEPLRLPFEVNDIIVSRRAGALRFRSYSLALKTRDRDCDDDAEHICRMGELGLV